jgi:tetratricopeptide (TPR) repeat protein
LQLLVLPPALLALRHALFARRVSCDVAALVADYHYSEQLLARKVNEVNASFIQSMTPLTVLFARLQKKKLAAASGAGAGAVAGGSGSAEIKGEMGGSDTEQQPGAVVAPQLDANARRNSVFPLLLHTGQLDLLQQLLDCEYLAHQKHNIDKLAPRIDATSSSSSSSSSKAAKHHRGKDPNDDDDDDDGPAVSAASPRNVAEAQARLVPDLAYYFSDELNEAEERQLAEVHEILQKPVAQQLQYFLRQLQINSPEELFVPLTNAELVRLYRASKQLYQTAVDGYKQIFGTHSVLAADTQTLLANLLRVFRLDDEAKALYEGALKEYKHHALSSYQLPWAPAAHCWLGMASYFNAVGFDFSLGGAGRAPEYQLTSLQQLTRPHLSGSDQSSGAGAGAGAGGVFSQAPLQKNPLCLPTPSAQEASLALRLYEEALSLYRAVHPATHPSIALTALHMVGLLVAQEKYPRAVALLEGCVDQARFTLHKDCVMQQYLVRQLCIAQKGAKNSNSNSNSNTVGGGGSSSHNAKTYAASKVALVVARAEKAVEINEQAVQRSSGYLASLLVSLGRVQDRCRRHPQAIALYKEAIVLYRGLRMDLIVRFKQQQEEYRKGLASAATSDRVGAGAGAGAEEATTHSAEEMLHNIDEVLRARAERKKEKGVVDSSSKGGGGGGGAAQASEEERGGAQEDEEEEDEEEEEELEHVSTSQPEREFALKIAETMRYLAQSLFDEGLRLMGGKKLNGLAMPDFQYRHAIYVLNRPIEIYHSFDLSISAPLLKDAYTQKANMHILQGDLGAARQCFERIMRLFMEIKFEDCDVIARARTDYGRLLVHCGDSGEAALLFDQSIEAYRRRNNNAIATAAAAAAGAGTGASTSASASAAADEKTSAAATRLARELKEDRGFVCIEVAENLLERGAALIDVKALEAAQPCLEDAYKMLPMVLGVVRAQRDPRLASCCNHLASIFHAFEEYTQALQYYESARRIYAAAEMQWTLEMANICNNMATLFDDMVSGVRV